MIRKTFLACCCILILEPPVRAEKGFEIAEKVVVIFRPFEKILDQHFSVGRVFLELAGCPIFYPRVKSCRNSFFLSFFLFFSLRLKDHIYIQFFIAKTKMSFCLEGSLAFREPRISGSLILDHLQDRGLEGGFTQMSIIDEVVRQGGFQHFDGVVQNHRDKIFLANKPAAFDVVKPEDVHDESVKF